MDTQLERLTADNRRLTAEIERLRDRVSELEDLLHGRPEKPLPFEWGLTASEARIFMALLAREVCTKEYLLRASMRDIMQEEPEVKIVDVWVCKLRKKLAPFDIEIKTLWGKGYTVDERTRERLKEAMK